MKRKIKLLCLILPLMLCGCKSRDEYQNENMQIATEVVENEIEEAGFGDIKIFSIVNVGSGYFSKKCSKFLVTVIFCDKDDETKQYVLTFYVEVVRYANLYYAEISKRTELEK